MSLNDQLETLTNLADITLQLGQVERLTRHADGRNETVTTHSHMLALVVLQVGFDVYDQLVDPDAWRSPDHFVGDALGYALTHDLPEFKYGDFPTLRGLSPEQKQAKEAQEAQGRDEVYARVPGTVSVWLCSYENQCNAASRLVHLLDKMMPKLVLIANNGNLDPTLDMSVEELIQLHRMQQEKLRVEYPEFPSVHELMDAACRQAEAAYANRLIEEARAKYELEAEGLYQSDPPRHFRDYEYEEDFAWGPECFGGTDEGSHFLSYGVKDDA